MPLFGRKKSEPASTSLVSAQDERRILSNLQRGTEIGDFIVVCKTDYVQAFSDPWIAHFEYRWSEYLLLTKTLLTNPGDLTALVFLPQDLSEVYYVEVPAMSPNHTHLSPHGRQEYELYPGYEQQVDGVLYRDYASLPKRSLYHSVDPQGGQNWDKVVEDVLSGYKQAVAIDYDGIRYDYAMPRDKKEAEASAFVAIATRRGAYPMEETLRQDARYDIVPSVPNGVAARVTVREFVADNKSKAPFHRIAFQRTELKPGTVESGQPLVMNHISFGDELDENESVITHLFIKYVQLDIKNPTVKIAGYY